MEFRTSGEGMGAGDSAQNPSPPACPALGSGKAPRQKSAPQPALPGEAGGGDESLRSPLPFPPHVPSSQLGVFEAILSSCPREVRPGFAGARQASGTHLEPVRILQRGRRGQGGASDEPRNSGVQTSFASSPKPASPPPPTCPPTTTTCPTILSSLPIPQSSPLGQPLNQGAPPASQRVTAL